MPPPVPVDGPLPPIVLQLQTGSPTGGADCGPAVTLMLLSFASHNALRATPGRPAAAWIRALRQRMTPRSFWPATSTTNREEALEDDATRVEMARAHRSPVVATRFLPGTFDQVREQLRRGRMLGLAISYRELNRIAPGMSGDRAFTGDHVVGVLGLATDADGTEWVRLFDPTHDGRRPGIPKGPRTVRLAPLLQAAESRDGVAPGTASFLSVRRSREA